MRSVFLLHALALIAGASLFACGEDDSDESDATGGAGGATGGAAGASGGVAGAVGGGAGGGAGGGTGGAAGSSGAAGSGGAAGSSGAAGASGSGGASQDGDGDGLDDAKELEIAKSYYPFYSVAPDDKCPLHGVLFRTTPHPADATKIAIWYVVLFERDCGANGHPGDDEVFGALVDPKIAAPAGLLAVRTISHQGTLCEQSGTCGTLPKCNPCTTAQKNGQPTFVVFPSVNKHGNYVSEGQCDLSFVCDFGGCTLNAQPDAPAFANAGEPGKPLTNDLTTNGFISATNGWKEPSLMNFDPWGGKDFGSAGNVTSDLQDPAFLISPSGC